MAKKKKPYRTNIADIYSRPSAADVSLYKFVSDIEKAKRYVRSKLKFKRKKPTVRTESVIQQLKKQGLSDKEINRLRGGK